MFLKVTRSEFLSLSKTLFNLFRDRMSLSFGEQPIKDGWFESLFMLY